MNGDGKINSGDAALTYAYVNGKIKFKEGQLKAADVNGDGKINSGDAALIYAACQWKNRNISSSK